MHSLADLREIVIGVLERSDARVVVEIGAEGGPNTALLVDWLGKRGGRLVSIDPDPADRVRELAAAHPTVSRLVLDRSPQALTGLEPADVYLLDGDHNYATVFGELSAIRGSAPGAVVVLHDVAWPCGRRDMYYDPAALPEGAVHPHTPGQGVTLGTDATLEGGFRGKAPISFAAHEGGPKNGVMTAIDDFVAQHPEYDVVVVPAVFGLGVLVPHAHPHRRALAELLAAYDRNPILERLEENRLRNYLRVLELQDQLQEVFDSRASVAAHRDGVLQDLHATRAERDTLRAEVQELREQLEKWYHRAGSGLARVVKRSLR